MTTRVASLYHVPFQGCHDTWCMVSWFQVLLRGLLLVWKLHRRKHHSALLLVSLSDILPIRIPNFRFEQVVSFSEPITLTWTPTVTHLGVGVGEGDSSGPGNLTITQTQPVEDPPTCVYYLMPRFLPSS